MNPIQNEKQLSIVLPSHNRAFAEAIKNATPQELSALQKNLSPQNLLSDIFSETIKGDKSKQTLLELVKNSAILKELGPIQTPLMQMAEILKDEPKFQNTLKLIDSLSKDETLTNPKMLHQKIADSGVFLESKLERFLKPGLELSSGLKELVSILEKSAEEKTKPLLAEARQLLEDLKTHTVISKENPKAAVTMQTILTRLDTLISQSDPIHAKDSIIALDQLKSFQAQLLAFPSSKGAESVSSAALLLYKALMRSKEKESVELLRLLEPVVLETKNSLAKAAGHEAGYKEAVNRLQGDPKWNELLKLLKTDPEISKEFKNSPDFNPKMIPLIEKMTVSKTVVPYETLMGVKNILQSILTSLKPVPLLEEMKNSIEQILFKYNPGSLLPKELDTFIAKYEAILSKTDPLHSKEIVHLHEKLMHRSDTKNLPTHQSLQESLQSDLKGELLRVLDEIKASAELSKRPELTASAEKALTIIDYHQLLSHLSNSTSLYIPVQWDMLEEGNIKFKKREKEKFYCEIDLKLVEFGRLNLLMAIFGGNQLEIQIHPEQDELKKIIQENLPLLRSYLISAGLQPKQMRVYEKKQLKNNAYTEEFESFSSGFEEKA